MIIKLRGGRLGNRCSSSHFSDKHLTAGWKSRRAKTKHFYFSMARQGFYHRLKKFLPLGWINPKISFVMDFEENSVKSTSLLEHNTPLLAQNCVSVSSFDPISFSSKYTTKHPSASQRLICRMQFNRAWKMSVFSSKTLRFSGKECQRKPLTVSNLHGKNLARELEKHRFYLEKAYSE